MTIIVKKEKMARSLTKKNHPVAADGHTYFVNHHWKIVDKF